MRLTAEEYRRGLVKWNTESTNHVLTRSSDGDVSEWSEPLTNPNGSVSTSVPRRFGQVRISPSLPDSVQPFPVYWERLTSEGNIVTSVLDGPAGEDAPVKLGNIPAYGIYRRLVLQVPPTLQWGEDAVVRVGNIIVRTHSGEISGEKGADLQTVSFDSNGNQVLQTGWMGTDQRTGRFIEIVTDGADHADALLRSSAVMGLLGLVFGNSVATEILFSEPYQAESGKPQSGFFEIPNYARQPGTIDATGLGLVDEALGHFTSDPSMGQAVQLSLHWFDRGLRSRTPLDELISYFVSIESILNTFASIRGPIPKQMARRSHAKELKTLLKGKVDGETREHLYRSLQYVSTRDRFSFYRFERRLSENWDRRFKELLDARNTAFHGSPGSVTGDVAGVAKDLAMTMLKLELGIVEQLGWEKGPKVSGARTHYEFQSYDRQRSGPADD